MNIPNYFVYTSKLDNRYVHIDNSWFNCDTMKLVESSKYPKLNEAAIRQINKLNENSRFKIGKTYLKNGERYTFIGEGKFTKSNGIISESVMLNESTVPTGYIYTSTKSGKKYINKKGSWIDMSTKKPISSSASKSIDVAAEKQIENYNKTSDVDIGQEWTSKKGITYKFVGGGRLVSDDGKVLPKDISEKVIWNMSRDNYQNHDKFKSRTYDNPNASTEEHPEQDTSTDTNDQVQPEQSSQDDSNSVDSANSTDSIEIPTGYIYTSAKSGLKFLYKNGSWINLQTKKPMTNRAVVNTITRSASNQIKTLNQDAAVKIGDKWTSKKGRTYTFVGGNRFVSDDGKTLPVDISKKVMQYMFDQHQAEVKNGEVDNNSTEQSTEQQSGNTDVNDEQQVSSSDEQSQPESGNDKTDAGTPANGDDENSELQGLANDIKSNPNYRKITVLVSRGDPVSLLAADILLSGNTKEAVQILKSLNNEE